MTRATLRISNHYSRDRNNGVPYDDVDLIVPGQPAPWQLIDPDSRFILANAGINEFDIQIGNEKPRSMDQLIADLNELEGLRAAIDKAKAHRESIDGFNDTIFMNGYKECLDIFQEIK